jgi:NADH-quinone oxidoreductase subunit L
MLAARGVVVADHKVLDGGLGGLTTAFTVISTQVRKLQNGQVRTYALTMAIGVVAIGVVMILSQLG